MSQLFHESIVGSILDDAFDQSIMKYLLVPLKLQNKLLKVNQSFIVQY